MRRLVFAILALAAAPALAAETVEAPRPASLATTLPAGSWELGLLPARDVPPASDSAGPWYWAWPTAAVGLGDRWQLSLLMPELAYRFGEARGTEVLVAAGLRGFAYTEERGAELLPLATLAVVQHRGDGSALLASVIGSTAIEWGAAGSRAPFDASRLIATVGFRQPLGDRVTVTPGLEATGSRDYRDERDREATLGVGSFGRVAGRVWPLVELRLGAGWALDGHASVSWSTRWRGWTKAYGLGFTWTS